MKNRPREGTRGCPDEEDLAAYLRDECPPEQRDAIERHLVACEICRDTLEGFESVLARLQSVREEATVPDLSGRIIAQLPRRSPAAPHTYALVRVAVLAACVMLAFLAGRRLLREEEPKPDPVTDVADRHAGPTPRTTVSAEVTRALDWLAARQADDGSWDPGKWGGQKNFTVGLTGLSLLAFAGAGQTSSHGPHGKTVVRAIDYLLKHQDAEGRFGPFFNASPYNHGIATVALLETYALDRRDDLKTPLDRALALIIAKQNKRGGWGYMDPMATTNTSITAWQLHALILADSLGWSDARGAAEKGLAWLGGVIDREGRAGYRRPGDFPYGAKGVTAMAAFCLSAADGKAAKATDGPQARLVEALLVGASEPPERIDYVRWYFTTHALKMAERREARSDPRLVRLVSRIRSSIVERQLKEGPNSGSWEPTDPWSPAGGRVYATAMATLSLQADARTDRLTGTAQ